MPSVFTDPEPIKVSDIYIRVKRTFGDESGAQIDEDDILRWANDGQLDIARKTQCLIKTDYFNSAPDSHTVSLPVGFLFFQRATYNGRLLSPISYQEFDVRYPNREENYPKGVPEYISYTGNFFELYPAPSEEGTQNIIIIYVARPSTLFNSSDILEIPDQFYEALIRFCLMRAKELDGDWEAARIFQKSYEDELTHINTEVENPIDSSYPVVREIEDY